MKSKKEFEKFDHAMRQLLRVPHSEIKAKLDAEKENRVQRRKRKNEKPRVIELEGVDPACLLTPEGRAESNRIFSRNEDKLRRFVQKGGARLHPPQ
jgi:hypothetical protein